MIKNTVERINGGNFKNPVSKTDASNPASSPGALDGSSHHSLALQLLLQGSSSWLSYHHSSAKVASNFPSTNSNFKSVSSTERALDICL